jgi:hypothetical protein
MVYFFFKQLAMIPKVNGDRSLVWTQDKQICTAIIKIISESNIHSLKDITVFTIYHR